MDAAVLLTAALMPTTEFAAARNVIAVIGVAALAVGVWWQRPDARAAWWLIVAGSAAAVAAVAEVNWTAQGLLLRGDWRSAMLFGTSFALFIAGLALLGRLAARADAVDALDATMIALATFLVLFALVLHPVLHDDAAAALATATVLPVGALLTFAMAVRVMFTTGVPTISLGLLLAAVCAFVAAAVGVLVSSLANGVRQASPATDVLWVAYGVLLGAAGLHPSLSYTRRWRRTRRDALSKQRMVLFVILAVVAPVAWGVEIRRAAQIGHDPVGFAVPIAVSAVLLVLLVARLALTARVAQRHADQLARRSDELAEAVDEQMALQRQLRYQAMHDPLTGLSNRLVLTERMEWALARPSGSGQHAVALLDLDGFKDVNDTLGHPIGDELLIEAAHRLAEAIPQGGTLARLGGDEFAALLEDTLPAQALAWAEQTRRTLRRPYHIEDQEIFLSSSVGLFVTHVAEPPPTPSDALRDADLALYAAKAAGKDRVTVFRPELRTARMDVSRLSAGLRRALANNELELYYQPVVDLGTREIVSVEALMRWTPPGQPSVPPEQFIPVAEETGLIGPMGAWAMRRACHDVRPWYQRHGISVAVNVSVRQLDDSGFAAMVIDALHDAGLPGQALIIEITESSLVAASAISDVIEQLERLRTHHVRVAIDDFGTGYSSLASVARLPADIIKIDRSFVQNPAPAGGDTQTWAFTRAILQLVHTLHLEAVAEGVETLEQAEALRQLQCRLAQGYLFARAMPKEILDETLSTSASITNHLGNTRPDS